MFHHSTCPQADEADEQPEADDQFAEWMDLLEADEEASQGYAVPADEEMGVCW